MIENSIGGGSRSFLIGCSIITLVILALFSEPYIKKIAYISVNSAVKKIKKTHKILQLFSRNIFYILSQAKLNQGIISPTFIRGMLWRIILYGYFLTHALVFGDIESNVIKREAIA